MSCPLCYDGWIEIDDGWYPCGRCRPETRKPPKEDK